VTFLLTRKILNDKVKGAINLILSEAKAGNNYIVTKIDLSEEKKSRIMNLGLLIGTKIKVINQKNNGPMIIHERGTDIAIGREYTSEIFVQEL